MCIAHSQNQTRTSDGWSGKDKSNRTKSVQLCALFMFWFGWIRRAGLSFIRLGYFEDLLTCMPKGCGSKPMRSHFGVGAPPIFEPILVGMGCSLTVRDFDPWPKDDRLFICRSFAATKTWKCHLHVPAPLVAQEGVSKRFSGSRGEHPLNPRGFDLGQAQTVVQFSGGPTVDETRSLSPCS